MEDALIQYSIKTLKAQEVLFLRAGILIVDLVSLLLLLPLVTHPMQWEESGKKKFKIPFFRTRVPSLATPVTN